MGGGESFGFAYTILGGWIHKYLHKSNTFNLSCKFNIKFKDCEYEILRFLKSDQNYPCEDKTPFCKIWASNGACDPEKDFMSG